jgi:hypothetical protein
LSCEVMASPVPMPPTAQSRYTQIKEIGDEKDGTVYLVLPKTSPPRSNSLQALKIVARSGEAEKIDRALIKKLPDIQSASNHPVVEIKDCDNNLEWYTMANVPGRNAHELLSTLDPPGLPPFMVFYILEKTYLAQDTFKSMFCIMQT